MATARGQKSIPQNMTTTASRKRNTPQAEVWGYADPGPDDERRWRMERDTMEDRMQDFLTSFPASHWRPWDGPILHQSYKTLDQADKRLHRMVHDPAKTGNFNIIISADDPMADIKLMLGSLVSHCMLAKNGLGNPIYSEAAKPPGDHASPYNIIFRTLKLRSFEMGLTKFGDVSRSGQDTYRVRHAWIRPWGMCDTSVTREVVEEMANMLCHILGFMPAYPEQFGGLIPPLGFIHPPRTMHQALPQEAGSPHRPDIASSSGGHGGLVHSHPQVGHGPKTQELQELYPCTHESTFQFI